LVDAKNCSKIGNSQHWSETLLNHHWNTYKKRIRELDYVSNDEIKCLFKIDKKLDW
jgi:hypothetical protein